MESISFKDLLSPAKELAYKDGLEELRAKREYLDSLYTVSYCLKIGLQAICSFLFVFLAIVTLNITNGVKPFNIPMDILFVGTLLAYAVFDFNPTLRDLFSRMTSSLTGYSNEYKNCKRLEDYVKSNYCENVLTLSNNLKMGMSFKVCDVDFSNSVLSVMRENDLNGVALELPIKSVKFKKPKKKHPVYSYCISSGKLEVRD